MYEVNSKNEKISKLFEDINKNLLTETNIEQLNHKLNSD
jgi:hypothetical protein